MRVRHGETIIQIDVADYIDLEDEAFDTVDALYVRTELEDARRCLNRPERTPSEAIEHIERALGVIEKALKA